MLAALAALVVMAASGAVSADYTTPATPLPADVAGRLAANPEVAPVGEARIEAQLSLPEAANQGLAVAYSAYPTRDGVCDTTFVVSLTAAPAPDVGIGSGCLHGSTTPRMHLSFAGGSALRGASLVYGLVDAAADRVVFTLADGSGVAAPLVGGPLSWYPELRPFLADAQAPYRRVDAYEGDRLLVSLDADGQRAAVPGADRAQQPGDTPPAGSPLHALLAGQGVAPASLRRLTWGELGGHDRGLYAALARDGARLCLVVADTEAHPAGNSTLGGCNPLLRWLRARGKLLATFHREGGGPRTPPSQYELYGLARPGVAAVVIAFDQGAARRVPVTPEGAFWAAQDRPGRTPRRYWAVNAAGARVGTVVRLDVQRETAAAHSGRPSD